MEGFLTFIIIFVATIWVLGKIFPRLLLWYLQRKMKQGGGNGYNGGAFGNNGFTGFWSNAAGFNNQGFNGAQQSSSVDEQVRESKKQEGRVTVENNKEEREKVIDRSMGEYVDFEEEKN